MIPSPVGSQFSTPLPHFYSVDDLFPLILMVTEPFDIFQKSVGKDTHYQNVNTDGFESAFFHTVSSMQDRSPSKYNNIWCYDIEVVYSLDLIIISFPSVCQASSKPSSN